MEKCHRNVWNVQTVFGPSCMNRAWVFERHKRFKEGRESVRDDAKCGKSKEVNTPELIGQTVRVRVTMLRFYGSSGRDSVEEASTLQIGSVAFPPEQYTSPQLHPCHRLFAQNGHQDSSSPSLWSRPCSLWPLLIPLSQMLSLWENWEDERGCDEGHWHAHTRELPWDLPKVVRTVEQVHCSQRRLLRRGLKFHVCTINKSAHTKKSLETYRMHLVVWIRKSFSEAKKSKNETASSIQTQSLALIIIIFAAVIIFE